MQRSNRTPSLPQAELAVFDGQNRVGAIRRRDGLYIAKDARNRELGRFETLRGAMRAIPQSPTTKPKE
jgi:hypothetical protein